MNQARLIDLIDHMQQASNDACSFVEGLGKEDFFEDKRTQNAVLMSILVLGEAATKLMDRYPDFVKKHPEISWNSMKGMRNRLAHGYFDINLDVVWDTVTIAVPDLRTKLPQLQEAAIKEFSEL